MDSTLTTVNAAESAAVNERKEPFLFERLGGEVALVAVLDIFYNRMVVDEQLAKFFDGISITRLKVHQKKFLTIAFTEIPPDMDVGQYMVDKHARLFQEQGLDGTHFDLVVGHLVAALQQLNVSESMIGEVAAILGPLRVVFADEADRIINESK